MRGEKPKAQQIADGYDQCRIDEQLLVGEPQLITEQEGEGHIDPHHTEHGHQLDVLTHQRRGSHHVLQVGKVDTARQLEQGRKDDVHPGAHPFGHPRTEHRHRPTPGPSE